METIDYILIGGRLALPDRIATGLSLVVRGGLISEVVESGSEPGSDPADLPCIDAAGALVTPGLFEFHLHGAGGVGCDQLGPDPMAGADQLHRLRAFLRARGVTGFLPTLVADLKALEALALAIETAALPEDELPGIYLEGPFVAETRRGGIPLSTIKAPDRGSLAELLAAARGRLRVMTVAPELPGIGEIVETLREAGVLVSLGHSACRIEEVKLPDQPYSITHLFNAMSGFSHKDAGLATLPFCDPRPFVELNADGVHVGRSALAASRNALDPDRLILISDAVVAAGLPPGEYLYHGHKVVSAGQGVRYVDTGVLMGSDRLLPDVLDHWVGTCGADLAQAVKAATLTPRLALVHARHFGLAQSDGLASSGSVPTRGAIAPGFQADLAIWERPFGELRQLLPGLS